MTAPCSVASSVHFALLGACETTRDGGCAGRIAASSRAGPCTGTRIATCRTSPASARCAIEDAPVAGRFVEPAVVVPGPTPPAHPAASATTAHPKNHDNDE